MPGSGRRARVPAVERHVDAVLLPQPDGKLPDPLLVRVSSQEYEMKALGTVGSGSDVAMVSLQLR